jgi:hypothetical protein
MSIKLTQSGKTTFIASFALFILLVTFFLMAAQFPFGRVGVVLFSMIGAFVIVTLVLAFWKVSRVSPKMPAYPERLEDIGHYDVVVQDTDCILEIQDPAGEMALYTKTKTIVATKDNVSKYTENGIWFDGTYDDFRIEAEGVRHEFRGVPENRNYFDIDIFFSPPLQRGEQKLIKMSWTIKDSFLNNMEFFTTTFNRPIKKYHLTVKFPHEKPVKNAWVNFTYMEKKITILDRGLNISIDHYSIDFALPYARPGMKSILFWEW